MAERRTFELGLDKRVAHQVDKKQRREQSDQSQKSEG